MRNHHADTDLDITEELLRRTSDLCPRQIFFDLFFGFYSRSNLDKNSSLSISSFAAIHIFSWLLRTSQNGLLNLKIFWSLSLFIADRTSTFGAFFFLFLSNYNTFIGTTANWCSVFTSSRGHCLKKTELEMHNLNVLSALSANGELCSLSAQHFLFAELFSSHSKAQLTMLILTHFSSLSSLSCCFSFLLRRAIQSKNPKNCADGTRTGSLIVAPWRVKTTEDHQSWSSFGVDSKFNGSLKMNEHNQRVIDNRPQLPHHRNTKLMTEHRARKFRGSFFYNCGARNLRSFVIKIFAA